MSNIGVATVPAHAQFFGGNIVFDPKNYTQNVLEAARALQQIDNQIRELQNEAQMLLDMGKDLSPLNVSQLQTMVSALSQISTLMNRGNGIAFDVGATNSAWNSSYPASYPPGTPRVARKDIRNVGVSVRARLTGRARARHENVQLSLTRYAIERLLYRLGASPQCDQFVLKGAMLFSRWADIGITGRVYGAC